MQYYFAPMEGVTGYLFRRTHQAYFPGIDQYWMPFWSPTQDHIITPRARRDLLPEHNEGVPVLPQILTKSVPDFLWAAGELQDMGYSHVNLNLGCPSGTVTAKGKGSGFLADLPRLEQFLNEIFDHCQLDISVKTRLGIRDPEEFEAILELYRRYPIRELTVHVRVREDQYKRPARPEWFEAALHGCRCPVCYNGDLKTREDCEAMTERYPQANAMMIGRGLLADPAMVTRIRTGASVQKADLEAFCMTLYEGYCRDFGSAQNAMKRMKEIWRHLILLFADRDKHMKHLRKASDPAVFSGLMTSIFRDLTLLEAPEIDW